MIFEMPVESNSIFAGLSAVAGLLAALFAYRSYKLSKKALAIAESESDAKKANITVYLADSFRVYDTDRKKGKYIFSIAYFNKSDMDDSITEIHLEIFYVNSANKVSHLMSSHEPDSAEWLSGNAAAASLPLNIKSRSSVTSWFVFGALSVVEKAQRIAKYRVVARNGQGKEVSVESYILREVEYEKLA